MTDVTTPALSVTTEIDAEPAALYDMVSDVTRMGEWSPENVACKWIGRVAGPTVGARFKGTNTRGKRRWSTVSEVIEAERGEVFAFRTTSFGLSVAVWRYRFAGIGTAGPCTVTEEWEDERGRVIKVGGHAVTGVADREAHNRAGMELTLAALKAAAEAG